MICVLVFFFADLIMVFQLSERSGYFSWLGQLPRGLGSFNGLAGLCISVGCVRLAVLWRFCRLVVTWCFKDLCGFN